MLCQVQTSASSPADELEIAKAQDRFVMPLTSTQNSPDSNLKSERPYDVSPAKQIQTMLSKDEALRRELSEIRTLGNAIDGFNKEAVVSL